MVINDYSCAIGVWFCAHHSGIKFVVRSSHELDLSDEMTASSPSIWLSETQGDETSLRKKLEEEIKQANQETLEKQSQGGATTKQKKKSKKYMSG